MEVSKAENEKSNGVGKMLLSFMALDAAEDGQKETKEGTDYEKCSSSKGLEDSDEESRLKKKRKLIDMCKKESTRRCNCGRRRDTSFIHHRIGCRPSSLVWDQSFGLNLMLEKNAKREGWDCENDTTFGGFRPSIGCFGMCAHHGIRQPVSVKICLSMLFDEGIIS